MRDDRTSFFFIFADRYMVGHPPRTPEDSRTALRDIFASAGWECREILSALDDVADIYFDRVSQIKMERWSRGRVAIVGDAACCVSLLAGDGTGLALTEAYVVAGELHGAQGDYSTAFDNYERRLRPFVTGKQELGGQIRLVVCPDLPHPLCGCATCQRG